MLSYNRDAAAQQHLLDRRKRLLGPAYRVLYDTPFHPIRGEGVRLYDADGAEYLDVYNNVPSVGHCHPRVVEALSRQAATLNTHTRYLHETVLDYAERLLATFPDALSNVMFTCTGSEANDLAVRVARAVTGNQGFIVTANAYHGVTASVAEMSPSLGAAIRIGDHVRVVDSPDSYRLGTANVADAFTQSVQEAIDSLTRAGMKPAAILFDSVFAADGLFTDPPGFIDGAIAAVREAGGLYIADEVQAGLARPGAHMWGFERHGIVPDIATLGKPMGNGHPLAAMIARPDLLQDFGNKTRYFNTFGGNPVSAAVGLAVLDVIHDENLMGNALEVGGYLANGLRELMNRHEFIGDVRAAGLYAAVELVSDRATKTPAASLATRIVNALRDRRVLIGLCGAHGNCLKVRPPLPFTKTDADEFLGILEEVVGGLAT
ncbi:aspartate aminotransferase family protein [Marinimicrococcus flavescens]|uniref:Aminotransferase class III-fold pyridoxal phosphate-dependent enzyme n=1 Tax=Marinimicrococcus flavescens TaxID=3031815 RepID=A0AAP4D5N0_9PROT|nr:aminotransferase class III-fold pyridoxal phosphate-dependent enzyme [Marinimicrococcus flavescens]